MQQGELEAKSPKICMMQYANFSCLYIHNCIATYYTHTSYTSTQRLPHSAFHSFEGGPPHWLNNTDRFNMIVKHLCSDRILLNASIKSEGKANEQGLLHGIEHIGEGK